jgi:hypothetical protein
LNEEDVHRFEDDDRRSYQIYDTRETRTIEDAGGWGLFKTRIDLQDLVEDPKYRDKRLLQFGSLFSGTRLNLAIEENQKEYEETFGRVLLENRGLDVISDRVRDSLGSYVAIHARTGSSEHSSVFWVRDQTLSPLLPSFACGA